ncbi:glycosyltransferase family 4 protein [Candidatus Peregrinibacteria bacterium]|nr:glycosyltransferase family 4 protein [Candidatus Peregrinibacteria bacterium]
MSSLSKARIGIVTWDSPPFTGGLGKAMLILEEDLRAMGATVTVLSPSTHRLLRITKNIGGHLLMSLLLPLILSQWTSAHSITLLIIPGGPGGLFLFGKPKRSSLVYLCYHTYLQQAAFVPGEAWKRIFIPLETASYHKADRVCCFSNDAMQVLLNDYGLPSAQFLLQSFDPAEWETRGMERDPDLCVCAARVDRRKGVDVLLQAWENVKKNIPTAKLVITGQHSRLSEEEFHNLLHRASIAVCPSYLEGFGLACTEALAAGTTVVASDCDGLRSLVSHQKTGVLVPPGDRDALADAITTLLRNAQERSTLSRNAKCDITQRFSRSRARDQLQAALSPLCSV